MDRTYDIPLLESRLAENYDSLLYEDKLWLALRTDNDSILRQFAGDEDETLRENVAANRHTPVETLVMLSADNGEGVRNNIALNPNTPVDTLRTMSREGEDWHWFAAQNPNCPSDLLLELLDDFSRAGLEDFIDDSHTSLETLHTIKEQHESDITRSYATNVFQRRVDEWYANGEHLVDADNDA